MANGRIRFSKQSGGQLAFVIPDGIDSTEVLLPESGELVTKEYIDNTAFKFTGDQTIAGVKTFSSSPIVPTPTTNKQAANKEYVDNKTLNINSLSDKPTPINTDNFVLQEAGGNLKKVSYGNLIKFNLNDSAVKTALNASGAAPIYACRAWVNFNGTGTVAIRASGNVSSITDNGVGDYTVNFATAMPDVNYSVSGLSTADTTGDPNGGAVAFKIKPSIGPTVSAVIVVNGGGSSSILDCMYGYISIFR